MWRAAIGVMLAFGTTAVAEARPGAVPSFVAGGDFDDFSGFVANDPSGGALLARGSTALPGWKVTGGSLLWVGPLGLMGPDPESRAAKPGSVGFASVADQMAQSLDSFGLPSEGVILVDVSEAEEARGNLIDDLKRAFDVGIDGTERTGETGFTRTGSGTGTLSFRYSRPRDPDDIGRSAFASPPVLRIMRTGFGSFDNGLYITGVSGFAAAIPEPATWTTMIIGFGLAGAAFRRRRGADARRDLRSEA